jgi:hypothetical protein
MRGLTEELFGKKPVPDFSGSLRRRQVENSVHRAQEKGGEMRYGKGRMIFLEDRGREL